MAEMLLKEEKIVVDMLSKYRVLKLEQIEVLLDLYKDEDIVDKIITGLKKRQIIIIDEGNFVSINPNAKPEYNTINAFWVLLKFLGKIDYRQNYPAQYPAEIFFLKDKSQYEIIVINEGDEHLLSMLNLKTRINSDEEPLDIPKLILVVSNQEMIPKCLEYLPRVENILFASIDYDPNTPIPNVNFFKGE